MATHWSYAIDPENNTVRVLCNSIRQGDRHVFTEAEVHLITCPACHVLLHYNDKPLERVAALLGCVLGGGN